MLQVLRFLTELS